MWRGGEEEHRGTGVGERVLVAGVVVEERQHCRGHGLADGSPAGA